LYQGRKTMVKYRSTEYETSMANEEVFLG